MTEIGTRTIYRGLPAAALFCAMISMHFVSPRAQSAILPLPGEQDDWSDMAFPSVVAGNFTSGVLSLTTSQAGDLEIGAQFGPSNPGRHYGTGGTLGGPFLATLTVSGVNIAANGAVTNGGTVLVTYNSGAPDSIGTDYGIANGAPLLQGSVVDVLLDATGADTLDVLYAISGGALQTDNPDPNVGVYAPNNYGLLRISAASAIPSVWTGDFSFNGSTIDSFGIPEPGTFMLVSLAGLFISLSRSPRRT
jgi:hypothetical protein